MLSSDESPSPDNDCKNNNNKNKLKQRKPDMQVYVPRAKRIEDQVKQRMSSENPIGIGESVTGDGNDHSTSSPSPGREFRHQSVEFRPTWEEHEEQSKSAFKEHSKKTPNRDSSAPRSTNSTTAGRKPPPQPQTNKLPSQVIEEMMKRHNITVPPAQSTVSKPFIDESTLPITDKEKSSIIEEEKEIQSDITTTTCEGDSSILSCLPATYQDFIMEELALNAAAASQRIASVQPALISDRSHSHSQTSASPTNSETPEIVQPIASCSGGRASPCLDAEDLEVKMINESFEEAQKQMQLYGSDAVKKAFYSQPNPVSQIPAPNLTGAILNTNKSSSQEPARTTETSNTSTSSLKSRSSKDNLAESTITPTATKPVLDLPSSKTNAGGSGKVTWAGWGTAKMEEAEISARASSKSKLSKKDTNFSASAFDSASMCGFETVEPHVPSLSSVPYFISTTSPPTTIFNSPIEKKKQSVGDLIQFETAEERRDINDTKEMDILSAAMVEKVLSEDVDDFDFDVAISELKLHANATASVESEKPMDIFKNTQSNHQGISRMDLADIWNRPIENNVNTSTGASSGKAPAATVDSWEDLCDESGEKMIAQLIEQVKVTPAKSKVERQELDYFTLPQKEVAIKDEEFGHVMEAYGFPPSVKGDDLSIALRQLNCREFRIEWVDDTHALIVFANAIAAQGACDGSHPVIKLRPLSQASSVSRTKVKKLKETLLPYAKRPDTSASLARRLVEGHLGKRSEVGLEQRRREKEHLQQAKEHKKMAAQQREDVWEGKL